MIGIGILIGLLTFSLVALFIFGSSNADLSERIRKANARAKFLLGELDDEIEEHGKTRERNQWLVSRLVDVEARELPQLDEIRERRAAVGHLWGRS